MENLKETCGTLVETGGRETETTVGKLLEHLGKTGGGEPEATDGRLVEN